MSESEEHIYIVDQDDNVITTKPRSEFAEGETTRAVCLWIENSRGDILVGTRAAGKDSRGGMLHDPVVGTVRAGESYLEAMIRETQEEIGLLVSESDLSVGPKFTGLRTRLKSFYVCQAYNLLCDQPIEAFTPDPREIDLLKWYTKEELLERYSREPEQFMSGLTYRIKHLLME